MLKLLGSLCVASGGALAWYVQRAERRRERDTLSDLQRAFRRMGEEGFAVYAAMLDPAARTVQQLPRSGGLGVVIGNEGSGVSPEVAAACAGSSRTSWPLSSAFRSWPGSAAENCLVTPALRWAGTATNDHSYASVGSSSSRQHRTPL